MKKTLLSFWIFITLSILCVWGSGRQSASSKNSEGVLPMKLNILINNKDNLTASLFDNSSSRAFVELLKEKDLVITMNDYGNFEKVGSLPKALSRNDTHITTSAGDIILNQITIYYDKNSWSFTRLGKIDGLSQSELKKILGSGSITAQFSLVK